MAHSIFGPVDARQGCDEAGVGQGIWGVPQGDEAPEEVGYTGRVSSAKAGAHQRVEGVSARHHSRHAHVSQGCQGILQDQRDVLIADSCFQS